MVQNNVSRVLIPGNLKCTSRSHCSLTNRVEVDEDDDPVSEEGANQDNFYDWDEQRLRSGFQEISSGL
jgi:hypothetical protein